MPRIIQFPPKDGVFYFLNASGSTIAAGVSRTDHSFGLVRSGFQNTNDALKWVQEARKRTEFLSAADADGSVASAPGAMA